MIHNDPLFTSRSNSLLQNCLYKILLVVSVFIVTGGIAKAQRPDSILNIAETNFPQEKIYLQTDKNAYAGGETVWFKAYLTADNVQGPFSKTVYAELITDKGAVLQRRTMPVILSGASSDFALPDSLADTRLFIRAYTSWMMNFDSSLLCVKPLYVIPKKAGTKKNNPVVYTLTFFPEGGDLVENIESTVAFKATDQDGAPVSIKGDIVNNKNKKITSFAPVHDGMGSFILQPLPGETYKAVWKDKAGKPRETSLPAANKQGVVIHTSVTGNKLFYTLTRPDSAVEPYTKFMVVAQNQQRLQYAANINLSQRTTITAPLLTDSTPDGVLQVTVFNGQMQPLAERLVFINNNNYSFITDLHMAEQDMNKRARSVLQVDVGGSLLSNMSVAVTDADVNPGGKNEENIYSSLLLSSDLKGYVYNPAYYFSSDDDSVKQHLDLVMMTNGWRRFKWENLLAGQWPTIKYQPENYLGIQGKVVGLSRTMLYNRSITGILKAKTRQPDYLNIQMSDKGEFSVDGLYFFDTARLYYQLSNDKDKNITSTASFIFNNSFIKAPQLSPGQLNSFYMPDKTDSSALLKSMNIAALKRSEQSDLGKVQVLQEVKVVTQKKSQKEKLDDEYTSGFFSGGDGYSFDVGDDPIAQSSPGVLEYLQGKVAGLQITTAGGAGATWRGSSTSFFLNESPSDVTMLQGITMRDVALIKVFRPPFMGGFGGGAGGAIAIYTKKGGAVNSNFTGLPSANIYGYSVVRQFYSPDYSVKNSDPFTKDYRTTLYWNPNVYFDRNSRRVTLPFYNNDNCKKIRVIVEGINEKGVLSREEKLF